MDTHIEIGKEFGLKEPSMIMLEQLRTVDKLEELGEFVGTVVTDEDKVIEIQRGLKFALGMQQRRKGKIKLNLNNRMVHLSFRLLQRLQTCLKNTVPCMESVIGRCQPTTQRKA